MLLSWRVQISLWSAGYFMNKTITNFIEFRNRNIVSGKGAMTMATLTDENSKDIFLIARRLIFAVSRWSRNVPLESGISLLQSRANQFQLNLKYDEKGVCIVLSYFKLDEKWVCFIFLRGPHITTSTSIIVMPRAKFCSDRFIRTWVTTKWMSDRIYITM